MILKPPLIKHIDDTGHFDPFSNKMKKRTSQSCLMLPAEAAPCPI